MSKENKTTDIRPHPLNSQGNDTKSPAPESLTAAMEETLRLYHAWLGYLLDLQNTDTLRVKAEDIRRALGRLSCSVSREGDEYVISLGGERGAPEAEIPAGGERCGG